MSLEMMLWRVAETGLEKVAPSKLDQEARLEAWIERDPSVLGMEIAIVGRQVPTLFGGRIDLLAIDRNANCVILELKRNRTPRDVVAQVLDYASWVRSLGFADLDQLSQQHGRRSIGTLYQDVFGAPIPESVNGNHSLVVVASELDDSSERIIDYLAEECGLSINAVFFSVFRDGGVEHLGRAWLKDPIETIERSQSKKRTPWSGYWFVNVGEGEHRNWEDNRRFGYIGAGQGEKYSQPLRRLRIGDQMFAYMKGHGYVGYGSVTKVTVPIGDFVVEAEGAPLLNLPLQAQKAGENRDSSELSEWAVGVEWRRTVPREQAKTFKGIFANQNIVCKLTDPKTIDFLRSEFRVDEGAAQPALAADGAVRRR